MLKSKKGSMRTTSSPGSMRPVEQEFIAINSPNKIHNSLDWIPFIQSLWGTLIEINIKLTPKQSYGKTPTHDRDEECLGGSISDNHLGLLDSPPQLVSVEGGEGPAQARVPLGRGNGALTEGRERVICCIIELLCAPLSKKRKF